MTMYALQFRERPLMFKPEMVRAIDAGIKTQTRRIIKPQPAQEITQIEHASGRVWHSYIKPKYGQDTDLCCPFGMIGDKIWVKETWRIGGLNRVMYRADYKSVDAPDLLKWRSAMMMPRAHSRLTLQIVDIRAQRLQDISEEDAKAEGLQPGHAPGVGPARYKHSFKALWFEINGKKFPWHSNPWVWAITFKKL